jgi:hypothetical protein
MIYKLTQAREKTKERLLLAVKVVDERLKPQGKDVEYGRRRVLRSVSVLPPGHNVSTHDSIVLTPDHELPSLLHPPKCIRPNLPPNNLPLLLRNPSPPGAHRLHRRQSLSGIEAVTIGGDDRGGVDHVVLGNGEAGKVVAGVILVWSPG